MYNWRKNLKKGSKVIVTGRSWKSIETVTRVTKT